MIAVLLDGNGLFAVLDWKSVGTSIHIPDTSAHVDFTHDRVTTRILSFNLEFYSPSLRVFRKDFAESPRRVVWGRPTI